MLLIVKRSQGNYVMCQPVEIPSALSYLSLSHALLSVVVCDMIRECRIVSDPLNRSICRVSTLLNRTSFFFEELNGVSVMLLFHSYVA